MSEHIVCQADVNRALAIQHAIQHCPFRNWYYSIMYIMHAMSNVQQRPATEQDSTVSCRNIQTTVHSSQLRLIVPADTQQCSRLEQYMALLAGCTGWLWPPVWLSQDTATALPALAPPRPKASPPGMHSDYANQVSCQDCQDIHPMKHSLIWPPLCKAHQARQDPH